MTEIVSNESPLAVVWTTVGEASAATELAGQVLDRRLAACAQNDAPIQSHYVWEGQQRVDTEYRVVFKTTARRSAALTDFLSRHHPYQEPQILVTPVTWAAAGYAAWVAAQTDPQAAD